MRIALLSDIHANLTALDAVLAAVGSVDRIWHLGDVVGYGPEPDATVERLAQLGATGVQGNHDAAACGGLEIEWFNPDARVALEWTRRTIAPATLRWLELLPPRIEMDPFTLVHGSPRDPTWEYVTSTSVAAASLAALATRHGLHGHTHVPMAWRRSEDRVEPIDPRRSPLLHLDDRPTLLNPGSVGQPRDGDPRAAWAILDTGAGTCSWQRTAYDIGAVQAAMRRARLPSWLIGRLSVGT
jgi:diadenosine tetraphosphatase ApaH/serine/threonine PP2A family protein phosphatase